MLTAGQRSRKEEDNRRVIEKPSEFRIWRKAQSS
jgi:hypothetical protein